MKDFMGHGPKVDPRGKNGLDLWRLLRRRVDRSSAFNMIKLLSSSAEGVFVGAKGTAGEIVVAGDTGTCRARAVRRRPAVECWQAANLDMIRGALWRKSGDDPNVDGEAMNKRGVSVGP